MRLNRKWIWKHRPHFDNGLHFRCPFLWIAWWLVVPDDKYGWLLPHFNYLPD